jgi:hypothetical protein
MAIYVLVNNTSRLIHVPTGKGPHDAVALIPGAVEKLEVSKENAAFFKATNTGVAGLDVFTEAKYDEYVKSKFAAESVLTNGLDDDDEPVKTDATPEVKPNTTTTGWNT